MKKIITMLIRQYIDRCWNCKEMTDYHDGRCERCGVKL